MKALKLKQSPDAPPIYGRWINGLPVIARTPQLWDDVNTIEDLSLRVKDISVLNQWELITIKIVVER